MPSASSLAPAIQAKSATGDASSRTLIESGIVGPREVRGWKGALHQER